ncbi:hypothetical protein Hamer_G016356, partial [Homarus americanus]
YDVSGRVEIDIRRNDKIRLGGEPGRVPGHIDGCRRKILKQTQPRDDYLRLMELCVIFLDGSPPRGIRFGKPGPVHHACWMSKALYSLQIFMFQHQFQLTIMEKKLIQTMSLFVALVYGPVWFKAPEVFEAPSKDISFFKQLHYYGEKIDESVGMAATKAFQRHLWYLSEESVALALFSEIKREILESMNGKNEKKECPKKLKVTEEEIPSLEPKNLASTNTNCFFQTTLLDSGFVSKDPSQWNDDPQFLQSREILQELQVVNDVAERTVKLIQDNNSSITKSEDQKQHLLQVVTTHRRSMESTRSKTEVWLIGQHITEITGAQLPSRGDVLRLFFHGHNEHKKTVNDSASEVAASVISFWNKARIPTITEKSIGRKVVDLFLMWKGLKKNCTRTTDTQRKKEETFCDELEDLFDVAHPKAMQLLTIKEDRAFLAAQREKGRRGVMAGVDKKIACSIKRREES